MGAVCTTVLPTRRVSKRASFSIINRKRDENTLAAHHHDTDDEEAIDPSSIRIPKFARDLIKTFEEEEDQINSDLIDPILLTKIRAESITYEFVRENGTKEIYRASSLIDYMLSTGHFHDPETRIDFTDDQLMELDRIGEKLGENRQSVFLSKYGNEEFAKKKEDVDAFAGVERLAGEYVFRMIRMIEKCKKSHLQAQDTEEALLVRVFPQYRHYVTLMFGLDRDETMVAVDQFKRFLLGPPNRPTRDRSNVLLPFCVRFVDEVMDELWREQI